MAFAYVCITVCRYTSSGPRVFYYFYELLLDPAVIVHQEAVAM